MPKRKQSDDTVSGIIESDLSNPAVKKLKSGRKSGIENAIINAAAIGANSFALFVKSQRKWSSPPFSETTVSNFKARLTEHGYDPRHILPHGSYLINLGNPDVEKRQKSYNCFLDALQRYKSLGLLLYNFHLMENSPGSTVGKATTDESISLIAGCINEAHRATEIVVTVLENMAGTGNIIGGDFTHLAKIIEQMDDKTRGYNVRTKEGWDQLSADSYLSVPVMDFDQQVGLSYLCGMHLNDSKTDCNSKKDRHENIGMFWIYRGHIGI
ncbi:xylose isomerase-like protein [Mycena olivaceomarginata]|nr:xylose isomerase-like protein [Mycena olivaceomarginata]